MADLETERGYGEPGVVQFSIFLDNRVGKLKSLLQVFEGTRVQVASIVVVDTVDCAIVRCVLVPTDQARMVLKARGLPFSETELVVVELPSPHGLLQICDCLVKAEVNIHYVYPLIVKPPARPAIALHVDEPALAATILRASKFVMLGEGELA